MDALVSSCLLFGAARCGCSPRLEAAWPTLSALQVKARAGAEAALVEKGVLKAVALAFGWPASSLQVLVHARLGVLLW